MVTNFSWGPPGTTSRTTGLEPLSSSVLQIYLLLNLLLNADVRDDSLSKYFDKVKSVVNKKLYLKMTAREHLFKDTLGTVTCDNELHFKLVK